MPLFKKKPFFSVTEQEQIVAAIKIAEQQTSGEIRVYAAHRNGVLIYMAWKDKEIALFGDEGIYIAAGKIFWENEMQQILAKFSHHEAKDGIINCIHHIGQILKENFPFEKTSDKNELPDNIVFGK